MCDPRRLGGDPSLTLRVTTVLINPGHARVAQASRLPLGGGRRKRQDGHAHAAQISRRALVIGMRAARIAGSIPPITPARTASVSPNKATASEIRKLKATSEKVWKLVVPVEMPLTGRARRIPARRREAR